jgi:hypothetical protein
MRRSSLLADHSRAHHLRTMNIISILIAILVLITGLIAFIPLLGWLYWIVIPVAVIGAVIGALSRHRTGLTLNILLIVIFGIRWWMGGFIF